MKTVFQDIFEAWGNSNLIAVIDDNAPTSYRDLLISARQLADFLSSNLPDKPIIAICADHGLNYIRGLLASILCDGTVVPINPAAAVAEKLHILENSMADGLLLAGNEEIWGKKIASGFDLTLYVATTLALETLPENCFKGRMLIYTSGTTSKPKGVLLSDRSLSINIKAVANNFGIGANDSTIIFSPPAYAMAMTQIFSYLWAGAKIVCWPYGLRFPAALVDMIGGHQLTGLTLSPSAARIIKKSVDLGGRTFPRVRYVSSGGMPLYAHDIVWYQEVFPGARVINFYGCTENSPRITHYWVPPNFEKNSSLPLPVGKALDNTELRVVVNDAATMTNNCIGEIHIRGSSLMAGYWKNEDFTATKFDGGWFKTGDSGFIDDDGNLNLCGRVDNVFSVGHEKVAPEEVEAIIAHVQGVEEVVLTRMSDPLMDFVAVALVVTSDKGDIEQRIIQACKIQLSSAKLPRRILFINEVPKTPYGKIDRRAAEVLVKKIIGMD
jgi:long-chain acyl-CoA synthetase